jgi:hypothetical protein
MNLIQAAIHALLPSKRKTTPSGWISFNAPCCVHTGERADKRLRGGIVFNHDGFQYHCFNCGFKAGWTPGKLLSKNTKNLLKWLNLPEVEIHRLGLEALKAKEDLPKVENIVNLDLREIKLPENTKSINKWVLEGYSDPDLLAAIDYIAARGMEWDWYDWHWSDGNGYRDRVIIPFYDQGKIVGYTGRKIKPGKPKYLTDSQPGYIFNLDRQYDNRKYVIGVEGQFDAIAIDGVAFMHNEPNAAQCARLKKLEKEIIIVPDKDKPGAKLIKAALMNGWSVSLPRWEEGVKDVADAVKKYGRLYTLASILHYRETNEIKIQLLQKKLESLAYE